MSQIGHLPLYLSLRSAPVSDLRVMATKFYKLVTLVHMKNLIVDHIQKKKQSSKK